MSARPKPMDDGQLTLPLAISINFSPARQGMRRIPWERIEIPEKIDWDDAEMEELHRVCLEQSLKALNYAKNQEEKKDVLEWVFSPRYRTIEGKRIDMTEVPFSYRCCCAFARVNPEEFQALLIQNWKQTETDTYVGIAVSHA